MKKNLCISLYRRIETFNKDGDTFAKCPFRGNIYYPENKPEEKVRLALLYYLNSVKKDTFRIQVEVERYDITVLNKTIGDLVGYVAPSMIIETKREGVNLIEHKLQLINYMKEKKTSFGLLFSCSEAFFIEHIDDNFVETQVNDVSEIVNIIDSAIIKQKFNLKNEITKYDDAQGGSFDAFKVLALKYRRGMKVKFIYKESVREVTAEGHLFDFSDSNLVYFNYVGYDVKREQRPYFSVDNFIRLSKIYR